MFSGGFSYVINHMSEKSPIQKNRQTLWEEFVRAFFDNFLFVSKWKSRLLTNNNNFEMLTDVYLHHWIRYNANKIFDKIQMWATKPCKSTFKILRFIRGNIRTRNHAFEILSITINLHKYIYDYHIYVLFSKQRAFNDEFRMNMNPNAA